MIQPRSLRLRAARGLALAALAAAAPAAAQTTWHVRASAPGPGTGTLLDPYKSIQYAIDQPTTLDGDTLLVQFGTYVENVDLSGKTLSLRSQSGPLQTVIDGSAVALSEAVRSALVVMNGEGAATSIEGFTLRGGHGTSSPPTVGPYRGGVVYVEGTAPSFVDCVIEGGQNAWLGGGFASWNGSPRLTDCTLTANVSDFDGGGAHFEGGAPVLVRVSVVGNTANARGGGLVGTATALALTDSQVELNGGFSDGPGVFLAGSSADLLGCRLFGNGTFDGHGGGLYVDSGSTATLTDCEVSQNEAYDHRGGGLYVGPGGSLDFDGGRLEGNCASQGGGAALEGAAVLSDVRIEGNRAEPVSSSANGGGVSGGPQAVLERCVLIGNQVAGSGPWPDGGAAFGQLLFERCTVVANTAPVSGGVAGGAILRDTIHWGNSPAALDPLAQADYCVVEGGFAGTGNLAQDPLLWDAAAGDVHLLLGSPAIDAGDPVGTLDPDGSRADIGARFHVPGHTVPYCTAGVSAVGCVPALSATGVASASGASGFVLTASGLEGQVPAIVFHGSSGRQAAPWGTSSSFQCVVPPVRRTPLQTSGGQAGLCSGSFSIDLNAVWCPGCPKPQQNPGVGALVQAQAWYRDPANTSNQTTGLSRALELQVQP